MTEALSCAVCGSDLKNVYDGAVNQPSEGVTFRARGQYGSTVFDPMDGSFLEINVCDPCVRGLAQGGLVLHGRDRVNVAAVVPPFWTPTFVGTLRVPVEYASYDPDAEYEDRTVVIPVDEVGTRPGIDWAPAFKDQSVT